MPGVVSAEVTLNPQQAVVVYDPEQVTAAEMIEAIEATEGADPDASFTAEIESGDCV